MKYTNTFSAKFIDRPNRFVAHVELDGKPVAVHVKNTGRCRELLLPGASVILEKSENPTRKYAYDLVMVEKPGLGWVNIDSQAPNKLACEWLKLQGFENIHPEYTYGESRLDFYMEKEGIPYLMEVKGCTLEREGIGYFPDAPTARGARHLRELKKAAAEGFGSIIAFVIQMNGIAEVRPNVDTDPDFAEGLKEAVEAGVQVVYITCSISEDEVKVTGPD